MKTFGQWTTWEDATRALAADHSSGTVALLGKVWQYAEKCHAGQTRPAGEPYTRHLLEVLEIMARELRLADPELLSAGLLHDIVEDTDETLAGVASRFGEHTARLVGQVTMPDVRPGEARELLREKYLAGLRKAPDDVLRLKLSDRYSNVQRLHTHPRVAKQRSYYAETVEYFVPLTGVDPELAELFGVWREAYDYLNGPVDTFTSVDKLAAALHREQVDKGGEPYIEHVRTVAKITRSSGGSEHQQLAALLHDAVEDTSCTLEQLYDLGVPDPVVEMVDSLTHGRGESQEEYLARVVQCPDAVLVKRADIEHNCSPDRLGRLETAVQDRLRSKYARALDALAKC